MRLIIIYCHQMQVKFKGLNIDQVKKGIAFGGQDAIMDQRKECEYSSIPRQ